MRRASTLPDPPRIDLSTLPLHFHTIRALFTAILFLALAVHGLGRAATSTGETLRGAVSLRAATKALGHVPKVRVFAIQEDSEEPVQGTVADDGTFEIKGALAGVATLYVTTEEGWATKGRRVKVAAGGTKDNIRIRLQEGARLQLFADPEATSTDFVVYTSRSVFADVTMKKGESRWLTVPATVLDIDVHLPEPVDVVRTTSIRIKRGEKVDVSLDRDLGWADARSPLLIGFILLDQREGPAVAGLSKALANAFPEGKVEASKEDSEVPGVTLPDGSFVVITHIEAPVPGQEAEEIADRNVLWPNGREEAARHKSHFLVVTNSRSSDAVDSALIQTRALRAVAVAAGKHALGVQWGQHNAMRADLFRDLSENASRDDLPLTLWIRTQMVITETDGERGLYTLGLDAFGLMEIEITPTQKDFGDLMDEALGISSYLISAGPVINDGDTVGGEGEKNKITFEPSMIDEERTVYRLTFAEDKD